MTLAEIEWNEDRSASGNETQNSETNNLKVIIGELNFVSRITQSRYIGIGNYPTCEVMWDRLWRKVQVPVGQKKTFSKLSFRGMTMTRNLTFSKQYIVITAPRLGCNVIASSDLSGRSNLINYRICEITTIPERRLEITKVDYETATQRKDRRRN